MVCPCFITIKEVNDDHLCHLDPVRSRHTLCNACMRVLLRAVSVLVKAVIVLLKVVSVLL